MKRTYFRSIHNPTGAEDKTKCVHTVDWKPTSGWKLTQCSRKRGHGPDGLYCKQHARIVIERT